MKKQCKPIKKEYLWIAFGVGAALALCLPSVWITRILAVCVIILGILCCKS
ncbi:MAG: hypothetical protein IKR97_03035 [Eubacterium sp.]|nr:hypothetical protein [Eubacterium sp.]